MKIEIEESALDSLKAMVQQLQDERDMLFGASNGILPFVEDLQDEGPEGCGWKSEKLCAAIVNAQEAIAACTETKQVLT